MSNLKMSHGKPTCCTCDPAGAGESCGGYLCCDWLFQTGAKVLMNRSMCCWYKCWICCDTMCGKNDALGKAAWHSNTSASRKPTIVWCRRTIKDKAAYTADFAKFATAAQAEVPGVRMFFSFIDNDLENTAMQLFWFDTESDWEACKKHGDLSSHYCGSPDKDYCVAFGDVTDAFKASFGTDTTMAYSWAKGAETSAVRGFIRSPGTAYSKGFDMPGPTGADHGPMIWVSRRNIKKGRMGVFAREFQKACDLQFMNAPGMLASIEFTTPENPDQLFSLRLFNDYVHGHVAHFPKPVTLGGWSGLPSCTCKGHGCMGMCVEQGCLPWTALRVLIAVLPEFGGPFDWGYAYSSKKWLDDACDYNPGNKAYKPYHFDSEALIGPKPDFKKGNAAVKVKASQVAPGAPEMVTMTR